MNAQLAPLPAASFDLLAIVASAGGLDAMTAVLADLPASFPAAVVVGQHLGADSALVEILERRTALKTCWAADGMPLLPGTLYVAPPHLHVEILPDRTCALHRFEREVMAERPLDRLLASVADSFGPRALAVVLTGMGRDGAAGARAVRSAGGAVIVQDEESAAYPEMPRAAAQAGAADLILPLGRIGRAIADVVAGGRFPQPRNEAEARDALFAGAGEARSALRAVDWAGTALGDVREWPQALKAVVTTILHSRVPTCIFWGPEFQQLYNDAWISVLGKAHPAAGVPAHATWDGRGSKVAGDSAVLATGLASGRQDEPLDVERHGFVEEAYFTVSHSPLHDDAGTLQGVLTIATETTERVLSARRQHALRALAAAGAGVETVAAACDKAAGVLAGIARDLPFALLYLTDTPGMRASLVAAVGLKAGTDAAPDTLDLVDVLSAWPVARVLRQGVPLVLHDVPARLRGVHVGPWPEPPACALLLPVRGAGPGAGGAPAGVLVAGLSPRVPLDDAWRDFAELVAQQLGANLAEARLRERERERMAQLAELDRTRTEFFSNVSHEFRTPLTLILGPLEDLLAAGEGQETPMQRELRVASRNARRLLSLVDALLDFTQIEAARLRADFRPTDLAALTADIAGLFRSAVERAGLAFDVDCPPLPRPVWVDSGMWEKIVSNLLANALKFTFEGTITVRLRDLGQHVELAVVDTGIGIPEQDVGKVFHRFHRVCGARARTEEGAGIGLALVRDLVELHHGRVRVRSAAGRGSTFTVWLPAGRHLRTAAASPAGAHAAGSASQQIADEAGRWASGAEVAGAPGAVAEGMLGPARRLLPAHLPDARLLVVDDNADMRDYLARTLGALWTVVLAANGEDALRMARAAPPDLVLADVMMPVLDGFGLLRALRADPQLKATPVVLVTARAQEDAAIALRLAGADDYIAKPFSSRELVARIGAQLELARVRRRGEREVRELLALMPVGVYACDQDGRFAYWNAQAVELWGREPGAADAPWALLGAPRVLAADGRPLRPEDGPVAQVLRTGTAVRDHEFAMLRVDCARREILVNVRPVLEEGEVAGAVAALVDVTARKQAQRAVQVLNEELEDRVEQRTSALAASEALLAAELRGTRLLSEFAARLSGETRAEVIHREILETAIGLAGAEAGTVQLLDADTGELVMAVQRGDTGLAWAQSTSMVGRSGRILGMFSTHSRSPARLPEHALHHLDLLARLGADLLESRHNALLTGAGEQQ